MNRSLKFRSLLTTTSMVALFAAPGVAHAFDTYYNNVTIAQMLVTTTASEVRNDGTITNEEGDSGIKISGQNVYATVTNTGDGIIDIFGGHTAIGIEVDDSYLYGVANQGYYDGDYYAGSISATATDTVTQSEDSSLSYSADASATGISLYETTVDGTISNDGSIAAEATSTLSQSASDTESEDYASAYAEGYSSARAAGIDVENNDPNVYNHRGPEIAGYVDLSGTISAIATANSSSSAEASATDTEDGYWANAIAYDQAYADSYGVRLAGTSAYIGGDVYTDAHITATANVTTQSDATASSNDGDAWAAGGWNGEDYWELYEGSTANASSIGLWIDVLQVDGDIYNGGTIEASATSHDGSIVGATGSDDATAYADNNYAEADATGIDVSTLLVSGGFNNDGDITATSNASANLSATATAGDRAYSSAESDVYADSYGIYFNVDALGGGFENSANFIDASATASSIVDATSTGGEYSEAHATSYAYTYAFGLDLDINSIAGDFLNTRDISATALTTGQQTATVSNNESLVAEATSNDIYADAEGIYLYGNTLAGSFVNDGYGEIDVSATAQSTSTATATGLDDVEAIAGNYLESYAYGIDVEENEIQDSVVNYGDINVDALSEATQVATATAANGEGDAEALAGEFDTYGDEVYAYSEAGGLYIGNGEDGTSIGGNIVNYGNIAVDATSNVTSTVEATAFGTGTGLAWGLADVGAQAYGIQVLDTWVGSYDITDEGPYARGYFVNEDDVTASAETNIEQTVTAHADDGDAAAGSYGTYNGDFASQAIGIQLSDVGLLGSVLNYGSVGAGASSVAGLTANSNVDDGDETYSLAAAGGSLNSDAIGIQLDNIGVYADSYYSEGEAFYNDAQVYAYSYTDMTADANADSDDGSAVAISGLANAYDTNILNGEDISSNRADASSVGIEISDSYFDGDVVNDGQITVYAFADIGGTAESNGDETSLAVAENTAYADATGFDISDSQINGDIYNDGLIGSLAGASNDSTAHAYAQQGQATAEIGYYNTPYSDAYATGLSVDQEDGTNIHNSEDGEIVALASATGQNYSLAEGWSDAYAYVDYEEYAEATGVISSSEYGSTLFNDGLIHAEAYSDGEQTATASALSASGESDAYAYDYSETDATGVSIVGSIQNTGAIEAVADSTSNVTVTATGDTAYAEVEAYAEAAATGAQISSGSEDWEYVQNSGTISASATATATATTTTSSNFPNPDLEEDAYASAEADAWGLWVTSGTNLDYVTNTEDGVISASAVALATENDDLSYNGSAYATGLAIAYAANIGDITNEGLISASAQADDRANAIGLAVYGESTTTGSLINSGTIQAIASSADDNASATAILLSGGGSLDTISNTGDILAYIEPYEPSVESVDYTGATAINAEGEGQGLTIEQLGGHIVGKILLSNSYSDHIEWSGGTIQGDISGNYGEDGNDVLDIFAGTDNAFTYAYTIDGLDAVRLNDDASSAVSLRLTGSISDTNSLYVGSNATLSLSSDASVSVNSLTLASTGTISYDLNSDGTNALITTSTADLGGGTVKAVFTDVQHPVTETYRIIDWDGSETTFGTVLSNSILEKVVAQYSEDGVDLVVTKVSFGGLDNLEDDAQRLGHALDGVFANISLDSDLGKALTEIIGLTPAEYERTMNEIAGQQIADLQTATNTQLGDLLHVIQTQLSGMRGNSQQASLGMDSLGIMVADNQVTTMNDAPAAGASAPVFTGNWSAWARAFGDWASLKRDGYRPGFTSNAGGVVAGVDYKLADDLLVGLAGGYQKTNLDFRGTGDGDVTSWSATAYGDYSFGPAYVDTLVGYSAQSYNVNRFLNVLGTGYTANSNYDGSSIAASVEAGYGFDIADNTKVTPYVGFNYTHTNTDAVTETGAGLWNLAYESGSDNAFDSVLGTRLSYVFKTSDGMSYLPTIELGWKHQYGDATPTTNAALAGTPGSNFLITGQEIQRDSALVGASLGVQLTDQIDGSVQYNGQYSSNYSDSTASVRLRFKF